jgi:hypothetical protein
MNELRKWKQATIEAVAGHFSTTWEIGEDPPDAYITIAGQRIAVQLTTLDWRTVGRGSLTKPHLRFDRVALGFVRRLQDTLRGAVPDNMMVILTVTAPIRLPSKTAAALEDKIRNCLARRPAQAEVRDTILGNQIRVRFVKGSSSCPSKVVGFVHSEDSNPDVLLDATHSLLECIGAEVGKRAKSGFVGDRWLVVANEDGLPHIGTYRHMYSQLSIPSDFKKILMVLPGGRVETLRG